VSWRPTPLNLSFLTLVGWALFLGVLTGRADLLVVAAPLLVALLARRTASPADWHITREVSADRMFEGERVTVTVTITARTRLRVVELLQPLPPLARLERGRHHAVLALAPGERVDWSFELACPGRQRVRLADLHVRVGEPLGLAAMEARHHQPATVQVYPHVTPLRHLPRPLTTQTSIGNYVSRALGEGLEPGEIRPFTTGDPVRRVNWRATLRLGTLHVTEYHRERSADVVLMLDTLSVAGADGASTLDTAVRGAASLAAAYLARKDRVGLVEYGGVLRWVKPGSGRAHFQRLLDTLVQADVVFTYVARDLDLVPPRVLPPHALVIALSPLLDARFVRAATNLAAREIDLVIIAVSPIASACAALRSPRSGVRRQAVVDVAARLWALERRAQLAELRRRGLTIVDWDGETPLATALATLPRTRLRRSAASSSGTAGVAFERPVATASGYPVRLA
jgi:uncharacterized protein (DUF58 family)